MMTFFYFLGMEVKANKGYNKVMNKKIIYSLIALVIIIIVGYAALAIKSSSRTSPNPSVTTTFDPLNTTYNIDGKFITLVNGVSEMDIASGSVEKMTTTVFGEPVRGDINADGQSDAALMLVQNSGGSGTFYYVAAAINGGDRAIGTNAIFLGDRIAPQNISIASGTILVNYADRKPSDPMSTMPSVGVSKYFIYNGTALVESQIGVSVGGHCGGNMLHAPVCATGYHCAPDQKSHLPFGDVGGICVPN